MKRKRGDGRERAREQTGSENREGMINEKSWKEGRRERIGWRRQNERQEHETGRRLDRGDIQLETQTNTPV